MIRHGGSLTIRSTCLCYSYVPDDRRVLAWNGSRIFLLVVYCFSRFCNVLIVFAIRRKTNQSVTRLVDIVTVLRTIYFGEAEMDKYVSENFFALLPVFKMYPTEIKLLKVIHSLCICLISLTLYSIDTRFNT